MAAMDTPTGMSLPTPTTAVDLSQQFSIDNARNSGKPDPAQAATLAREFEAMLVLQMVKSMRQSMLSDGEQEQGLGNETMTDTFDTEFARYLTQKGGFGVQEFIQAQIAKSADSGAAEGSAVERAPSPPTPSPKGEGASTTAALVAPAVAADARLASLARTADERLASLAAAGQDRHTSLAAAADARLASLAAAADRRLASLTPREARATGLPADADSLAIAREARATGQVAAADPLAIAREARKAGGAIDADDDVLTMPLEGAATTSKFGWRNDPFHGQRKFHSGVDLRAAYGTEVPAAAGGRVTYAGDRGGYGTLVTIQHEDGVETRYAHLSATDVREGDRVEAGQTIGRVGSSGRSTGAHLHFEVLVNGARVDPATLASRNLGEFKSVRALVD